MSLHHTLVAMAFAGIVSCSGASPVAAQEPDRLHVATAQTVTANSPQLRAVRQWLAQRAAPHAHGVGLDAAAWRSAVVTASGRTVALADASGASGDPFALLPAAGTPGEWIRVDAVTSRGRESWSYAWSADQAPGAWVLQRYAFDAVTDDGAARDAA